MVDAAIPALAILTRAPSSGGKTRLFETLQTPPDPGLLRALLLDTLDGTALPGLRRVIAVTPGSACAEVRRLVGPAHFAIDIVPQAEGDLGARMRAAMAALFRDGATAGAVMGSDLPNVVPGLVAEAFDALARDPDALVLGPAGDGGYYLIAACRVPEVFAGVEWGSDRVLAQTAAAAARDGLRVRAIGALADVDTADDLRRAVALGAPRTAAWVRLHAPGLLAP